MIKLLSVDPGNYKDAPTEGIRRILERSSGRKIRRGTQLDLTHVQSIRMGTTIATNALLERTGERTCLITTAGFEDLLRIGNQARPNIFDISCAKPDVLYESVIGIEERVTLEGYAEDPRHRKPTLSTFKEGDKDGGVDGENKAKEGNERNLVKGITGEVVRIIKRPDMETVKRDLQTAWDQGFRSVAIVLCHSYTFFRHEEAVEEEARKIGFWVSASSKLLPMIRMVPRGMSATADAYLSPKIKDYLDAFSRSFASDGRTRFEFMQSDGGLVPADRFSGLRAILSGPAGGVVGYAQTSFDSRPCSECFSSEEGGNVATVKGQAVIGFDMGGTSTDVSRYAGTYEHVFETMTAGVTIQAPQLDINTVAAGGGSILAYRNGMFVVGPESASAHPGPACYRKGGPLTVTDANLLLGRLLPDYFPKIFGPNEDLPLDVDVARNLFEQLTKEINQKESKEMSVEQVADGFLEVANEAMCRPIRALTEVRLSCPFEIIRLILGSRLRCGRSLARCVRRSRGPTRMCHRFPLGHQSRHHTQVL